MVNSLYNIPLGLSSKNHRYIRRGSRKSLRKYVIIYSLFLISCDDKQNNTIISETERENYIGDLIQKAQLCVNSSSNNKTKLRLYDGNIYTSRTGFPEIDEQVNYTLRQVEKILGDNIKINYISRKDINKFHRVIDIIPIIINKNHSDLYASSTEFHQIMPQLQSHDGILSVPVLSRFIYEENHYRNTLPWGRINPPIDGKNPNELKKVFALNIPNNSDNIEKIHSGSSSSYKCLSYYIVDSVNFIKKDSIYKSQCFLDSTNELQISRLQAAQCILMSFGLTKLNQNPKSILCVGPRCKYYNEYPKIVKLYEYDLMKLKALYSN